MCVAISIKIDTRRVSTQNSYCTCKSLNTYKISHIFYSLYLNNKLQQVIHSYTNLLKYQRIFKETWREVPQPKARAHDTCYRKPRHLIEAHHQTISLIVNFSSDSYAKFSKASAFGRLERWSNSQKSPKLPPQIDIVSQFNPLI